MDRNQLKMSDEDLALEFGHLMGVFRLVFSCRTQRPEMRRRLEEARAKGLSWVEALDTQQSRLSGPVPQTRNPISRLQAPGVI